MKQFLHHFMNNAPKSWLGTWIILYSAIIILSIIAPVTPFTSIVKISSIALCFVYAVLMSLNDRLLITALAITVVADFFLAFDNTSLVGLIIFVIAQAIHLFRTAGKRYYKTILALITLAALLIATCLITEFAPPIYTICAIYAFLLTCNILACWRWHRVNPKSLPAALATYGFLLFACCDLWTAISYLSLTAVLPAALYAIANFLAWFFYYPSQILISNSGKYATMSTVEGKKLMEVYGR